MTIKPFASCFDKLNQSHGELRCRIDQWAERVRSILCRRTGICGTVPNQRDRSGLHASGKLRSVADSSQRQVQQYRNNCCEVPRGGISTVGWGRRDTGLDHWRMSIGKDIRAKEQRRRLGRGDGCRCHPGTLAGWGQECRNWRCNWRRGQVNSHRDPGQRC